MWTHCATYLSKCIKATRNCTLTCLNRRPKLLLLTRLRVESMKKPRIRRKKMVGIRMVACRSMSHPNSTWEAVALLVAASVNSQLICSKRVNFKVLSPNSSKCRLKLRQRRPRSSNTSAFNGPNFSQIKAKKRKKMTISISQELSLSKTILTWLVI